MNLQLSIAEKADEVFIRDLFYRNKLLELGFLGEDGMMAGALLDFQFDAQKMSYERQYPQAVTFIINCDTNRVGKLVVDKSAHYHLVDIALLPEYQNKGIGRRILEDIITEAKENKKEVSLSVARDNPAQNLYKKLGFTLVEEDEMYVKMRM